MLLSLFLALDPAAAAEWGSVSGLAETNALGKHFRVEQTTSAVVIRGGVETALAVGTSLEEGDTVRTAAARVSITRPDGEKLWVSESSELVLTDQRSVLQTLGDVYYRLREKFETGVGEVEGAVEGTQYLVHVDSVADPVRVAVTAGHVTVSNPDDAEPVKRGREVTAPQRGDIPSPTRTSARERELVFEHAWLLGGPRLEVGGMGRVGYRGTAGADVFARKRLAPFVHLYADLGLDNNANDPGARLPVALGVAYGPRILHALVRLDGEYEAKICDCAIGSEPGRLLAFHLGGSAAAHSTYRLGRSLTLEGEVRLGYQDHLDVDALVGLGVGL